MKIFHRWSVLLASILLVAAALVMWWEMRGENATRRVDMGDLVTSEVEYPSDGFLRVAVAAMISPKETENSYFDLLRLIGQRLGREVRSVQRKTYAEVNELLERREIDLAFVCSGPYVEGHKRFGMEIVAVPVVHGATTYHSYFIVGKDSTIQNVEGLRGKRFAFTDPHSNTGYLVPNYVLRLRGESPESFFSETIFTHSHDNSIKAVADGLVDGAAVDSLIWEFMNATNPADTSRTRIIDKSPPYGIPPVVVHPGLDPNIKQRLHELFLHLHEDPEARPLLAHLQIERFVAGDDAMYDSVRQMQRELKAQQ